ncbi:MAG: thiamine phosphate synthase [Campylobacterota bacterium]|nr:thiamine phosphate synthase [Campylobacterota bacterium]
MKHKIKLKKETYLKSPFFINYFITDPIMYNGDDDKIEQFKKNLKYSLDNYNIDIICFRDKENEDTTKLAKIFLEISKKYKISKILINTDIEKAITLGFDGVHLTSNQFKNIKNAKKNNLYTIISCHTKNEIILAKNNNIDAITYSPIFFKENKGKPKGIKELSNIVSKYQTDKFKIIGLGGIVSQNEVLKIKKSKAYGFASIRYFLK